MMPSVAIAQRGSPDDGRSHTLVAQQDDLRGLIRDEIEDSGFLRDRIQDEVDRSFNGTMVLINVLLVVLTFLPILSAIYIWLLRRSVVNQIVQDSRDQLRREVEHQLEREIRDEVQRQADEFRQEINRLRDEFVRQLSQLKELYLDAQNQKEVIFQEIKRIVPSSVQRDTISPKLQDKIKDLTQQLEMLKSRHPQISLSADDYVKQGDVLGLEEQYQEAIASYDKAIRLNPDLPTAWLGKGTALRKSGAYEEAITCNERAIALQPDIPWGWFGKGYAHRNLHQYENALECYDRAIQLKPDYFRFWNHRGYVLVKLGRDDDALESLDRGQRLKPDYGNPYYVRAYYYILQGKIDPAIEQLRQAFYYYPTLKSLIQSDPDFDAVRDHPAFQAFMQEA
ncbi:MAG: tetratricopeptide repeat protein [Elainellaceae cyanobacterium]